MRARKAGSSSSSRPRAPTAELDIFADPKTSPRKSESRRPRRNSESSVIDRSSGKLPDADDEKKRRRRERERRHRERDAKEGKDGKDSKDSKGKKPGDRKLDVIDKLDVTSIYGTGCRSHLRPICGIW